MKEIAITAKDSHDIAVSVEFRIEFSDDVVAVAVALVHGSGSRSRPCARPAPRRSPARSRAYLCNT